MKLVDHTTGARGFQTGVEMRDGVTLNTFVFLPAEGGPHYPVILHRTPYGITAPQGQAVTDPAYGWLPSTDEPMRGSILRGWKAIVGRGYAAVYQDTRGRYASEGEDRVYAADAQDGVQWLAHLCTELKIPLLSECGFTQNQIPQLVEQARKASSMKGNPVALTSRELEEIITSAC